MAYDPPEENATTGADGMGGFGTSPHETPHFNKWPFDPYQEEHIGNDYWGEEFIAVHPDDEIGNKDYHPYELEVHIDEKDNKQYRCYFGTLFFSIAAIQTEAFTVSDGSGGTSVRFGIKGQSKLPGFGNIIPSSFINQNDGAHAKFAKLDVPNGVFGTVYLSFWLDAANHTISEATIDFVLDGEKAQDEAPCGILEKVNDELLRKAPTKGRYHLKIGTFHNPDKADDQITQLIEDHQYYATTIVDTSKAPEGPDGSSYATDEVAEEDEDPYGNFEAPSSSEASDVSLVGITNNPNVGLPTGTSPGFGDQSNQPNYRKQNVIPTATRDGFDTFAEYPTTIQGGDYFPSSDQHQNFGLTGAAGSYAPSDGTGYSDTGSVSSITGNYNIQLTPPTGGPGGSPSSTA